MWMIYEELGNVKEEANSLAVILSPPHPCLLFSPSPGGVSRLEGGVARCWWAGSVWSGLFAIHVYVAAPSSCWLPLLLSPLFSFDSLPLLSPPPPPLCPPLPQMNSGSSGVSVTAPPPASCLPFSPVSLVVFPFVCPLSPLVSSPLFESVDLLCVPPLVPWTGFFLVLFSCG